MINSVRAAFVSIFAGILCLSVVARVFAETQPQDLIHTRIIQGVVIPSQQAPIVEIIIKSGKQNFLCSGTLITPRVVLTAFHCVSKNPSDMYVLVGGGKVRVKKVKVHPKASKDRNTGILFNDVALLTLTSAVNLPTVSLLSSRAARAGDVVNIFGYGLDEFGASGTLRQGVTDIQNVSANFIVTFFDSTLKSNSCSGDSGGPVILSYRDVAGDIHSGIVGITSTGTQRECLFGDHTFYINLQTASVADFIQRNVPRVSFQ